MERINSRSSSKTKQQHFSCSKIFGHLIKPNVVNLYVGMIGSSAVFITSGESSVIQMVQEFHICWSSQHGAWCIQEELLLGVSALGWEDYSINLALPSDLDLQWWCWFLMYCFPFFFLGKLYLSNLCLKFWVLGSDVNCTLKRVPLHELS